MSAARTLTDAELEVASIPKGTPERREASKRTGKLAKAWRRMLDDVARARIAAGWARSSPLSWVYLGRRAA